MAIRRTWLLKMLTYLSFLLMSDVYSLLMAQPRDFSSPGKCPLFGTDLKFQQTAALHVTDKKHNTGTGMTGKGELNHRAGWQIAKTQSSTGVSGHERGRFGHANKRKVPETTPTPWGSQSQAVPPLGSREPHGKGQERREFRNGDGGVSPHEGHEKREFRNGDGGVSSHEEEHERREFR
jgi:hypothetical protein